MTKYRLCRYLALAALVAWSAVAQGQTSPETLQAQRIQRLEAILSQVRSAGIFQRLFQECAAAP